MSSYLGWQNQWDGRRWHFYPNPFSNYEDESIVPPPVTEERIDAEGNYRIEATAGVQRVVPA